MQLVSNHWSKLSISRYFKFYLLQLVKNNLPVIDNTIENDQGEEEEEEEEEEDLGSDLDDFIVEDSQSQELVSDVITSLRIIKSRHNFSLADEVSFILLTTQYILESQSSAIQAVIPISILSVNQDVNGEYQLTLSGKDTLGTCTHDPVNVRPYTQYCLIN